MPWLEPVILGLSMLCGPAPAVTSAALSPSRVSVTFVDGRIEERSIRAFPGASRFDNLTFSPGRSYAAWEVDYPQTTTSYDIPLRIMIVGPGTALEIADGFAVRSWKFLSDKAVQVCSGTVHGDQANRCEAYALPR